MRLYGVTEGRLGDAYASSVAEQQGPARPRVGLSSVHMCDTPGIPIAVVYTVPLSAAAVHAVLLGWLVVTSVALTQRRGGHLLHYHHSDTPPPNAPLASTCCHWPSSTIPPLPLPQPRLALPKKTCALGVGFPQKADASLVPLFPNMFLL